MRKTLLLLAFVFLASILPAFAGTITTTGSLSDWGITEVKKDGTQMNWVSPTAGVVSEVDPTRIGDQVGPGYGGAQFDAYAMYYAEDSQNAYFGIATGFPQIGRRDTANLISGRWLYPGDLALKFHGVAGDSNYQYGIRLNTALNTESGHAGSGVYGGFYAVTEWGKSYDGLYYQDSNPTFIKAGVKLGDAIIHYGNNTASDANADPIFFYEVTMPWSILEENVNMQGYTGTMDAHWTMSCGNDSLKMKNLSTPEPFSAALFLLGGAVISTRKFFKKKK